MIEDQYGNTIKKDGKPTNSVHREAISEESRETQKKAIKNGNTEKRLENLEKILFGKQIHEGEQ